MIEVHIKIYRLIEDKKLNDSTIIPSSDEIELVKTEKGMCFLIHKSGGSTTLFWSSESDVKFVRDSIVFLSEEDLNKRNKYINGEFI